MKEYYEKPEIELIDLVSEIFTTDSGEEEAGEDIFDDEENLLTSLFRMAKGAFGFDVNEDGNYVDADGHVYTTDADGNIVDADGNIVITADEFNAKNVEYNSNGENLEEETPDGENVEEEIPDQSSTSETDLDQLGSFAEQIADAIGDGGSGDIAIPDDTPSGSGGTVSEEPVYEEPVNETPASQPEGDYGFDGGTE